MTEDGTIRGCDGDDSQTQQDAGGSGVEEGGGCHEQPLTSDRICDGCQVNKAIREAISI